MKNNILIGNAAQNAAIKHFLGPAMVLAGPGSGKTFVIVERLKYLIREYKVDPSHILVITFTKAAAIQMQQRFMKITDSSYPEVCFGTFHSVFYQIIRQSLPKNKQLCIATESNKYRIIKDILYSLRVGNLIDEDSLTEAVLQTGDYLSEISRLKNIGEGPEKCMDQLPLKEHFNKIYNGYNQSLSDYGLIDFDDMILQCYKLLLSDDNLKKSWSKRFEFVLIDEYQDINQMQFKIIDLISENKNLFVVGDDDQSIYGFRGSDPAIMRKFPEIYRDYNPVVINLDTNYRCGKKILDASMQVISANNLRFKKSMKADENNIEGYVVPRRYKNKKQQLDAIFKFLEERKDNLKDIAFIFRTNSEAYHVAGFLKSMGIPTNLDDEAKSFTESSAVKLCENYLLYICGGKKREHFYRIMNKPLRYISRDCVKDENVSEHEVLAYYKGNVNKLKEIEKFFRHLHMLEHMRPSLSVRYLRKEIGIDKMFPNETDALNALSELAAESYDNKMLLENISKIREANNISKGTNVKKAGGNYVKLLTMHGSKGLEFEIVWLANLNEGIIPSRSSVTLEQLEEERRMLYVAMTRAKTALIMSYISGDENNPMLPTRFLREIRYLWEV